MFHSSTPLRYICIAAIAPRELRRPSRALAAASAAAVLPKATAHAARVSTAQTRAIGTLVQPEATALQGPPLRLRARLESACSANTLVFFYPK